METCDSPTEMNPILEILTFAPLLAASWHLACGTLYTSYVDWLLNLCE